MFVLPDARENGRASPDHPHVSILQASQHINNLFQNNDREKCQHKRDVKRTSSECVDLAHKTPKRLNERFGEHAKKLIQSGAAGLRKPAKYRSGKEQKLKNAQQIADNI